MMKKRNIANWQLIMIILIALALGVLLGMTLFSDQTEHTDISHLDTEEVAEEVIWTCSMHPQIRQPDPGDCPICGMDLIPVDKEGDEAAEMSSVKLTDRAVKLANIRTSIVAQTIPVKTIRLDGKVEADERRIYTQPAHVPGRIEKLYVSFSGQSVTKGDPLAVIYSPELVTAQQELLDAAAHRETQPALYRAARAKLSTWKLSEQQIDRIVEQGKIEENFRVYADRTGVVWEKLVNTGEYVKVGVPLFSIANLEKVWVMFDAYEDDLSWLNTGDSVNFTVGAYPGRDFSGVIAFIDPVVDVSQRVARVRVEADNPDNLLKPGMFATAIVEANLENAGQALVVPYTAVLWTGERSVVWVKEGGWESPRFDMREVNLGPSLGDSYIVESGLKPGEEIVTYGTFAVDAAAQLAGKPSMMNQMEVTSTGHLHDMPEDMTGDMQHEMEIPDLGEDFRDEFQPVLGNYFSLKDALVQSDLETAKEETAGITQSLSDVADWAEGYARQEQVETMVTELRKQVAKIEAAKNIDQARKAFIPFSDYMIRISKKAGPFAVPVYVQFCPMADNNRGAYWLSTDEQIRNPYYGDMMLTCGEVRDVIGEQD